MNKMNIYLKLLPIAVLLSACASANLQFKKMSESESTQRARVRVAANMLVRGIPESACLDYGKQGAGTVVGGILGTSGYRGRSLNMPNPNQLSKNVAEFYVTANQPFTIELVNTPESSMKCSVAGTFTPQAGHDYEIIARTERSGAFQSKCTLQLSDITNGKVQSLPIHKPQSCRK